MKGLGAGILLFLLVTTAFAQAPDPRDAVILESKLLAGGITGHPVFTVKVSITNKDTLANLTLPLELKTISGTAFVVISYPRTFAGTINRLTSTLGNNLIFTPLINSASPDSAVWSASWNPTDSSTAEPPNSFPKSFWEIRFDSVRIGPGQVLLDSAAILGNRVGFVNINGDSVKVDFNKGILTVITHPCFFFGGCPYLPFSVLFGRQFVYDFNDDCEYSGPHTYSIIAGPGSIDPITGVYSFSGQCPIGDVFVQIRIVTASGNLGDCQFTMKVADHPPTCTPVNATVRVSHGQAATNQINASDPDAGDGFVFTKLSGPGAVDANGVWTYTTGCEDVPISPQTVKIKVTDTFGECRPGPMADTCQFQLVVTNSPPFFTWPASAPK